MDDSFPADFLDHGALTQIGFDKQRAIGIPELCPLASGHGRHDVSLLNGAGRVEQQTTDTNSIASQPIHRLMAPSFETSAADHFDRCGKRKMHGLCGRQPVKEPAQIAVVVDPWLLANNSVEVQRHATTASLNDGMATHQAGVVEEVPLNKEIGFTYGGAVVNVFRGVGVDGGPDQVFPPNRLGCPAHGCTAPGRVVHQQVRGFWRVYRLPSQTVTNVHQPSLIQREQRNVSSRSDQRSRNHAASRNRDNCRKRRQNLQQRIRLLVQVSRAKEPQAAAGDYRYRIALAGLARRARGDQFVDSLARFDRDACSVQEIQALDPFASCMEQAVGLGDVGRSAGIERRPALAVAVDSAYDLAPVRTAVWLDRGGYNAGRLCGGSRRKHDVFCHGGNQI